MTERVAAKARGAYCVTALAAGCALATPPKATMDPYSPIPQAEDIITIKIEDFAHLPSPTKDLAR